ncbi:uncharacterized protein LOC129795915 [Lutzomyia longipalpis]|uniref:uncharacterized protein LOC129795915 n=1 Tax=Lutzomyia longipalpis TaxID=7200 RepID=UPI002483D1EA|nr:uncharacterized protein LOC129795915 [Lutzomyia longipalpis]
MNRPLCMRTRMMEFLPNEPAMRETLPLSPDELLHPVVQPWEYSVIYPHIRRLPPGRPYTLSTYNEYGAIQGVIFLKPVVPFARHVCGYFYHYAPRREAHRVRPGSILIERSFCRPLEINRTIIYVGIRRYSPISCDPDNLPTILLKIVRV